MEYACSHTTLLTCFVDPFSFILPYPTSLVHSGTVWLYESFHFPLVCNKITLGITHFWVSLCLASPLPLCMCVHTYTYTPAIHTILLTAKRKLPHFQHFCWILLRTSSTFQVYQTWLILSFIFSFSQCLSSNEFWFQSESPLGGLYKHISTSSFSKALTCIIKHSVQQSLPVSTFLKIRELQPSSWH